MFSMSKHTITIVSENTIIWWVKKHKIITTIIHPLLIGLKQKLGITFKGILHISCIINNENIIPLNFSCRFKNPETTYLMNHIKTDIYSLLKNTFNESINNQQIEWDLRSPLEIILVMVLILLTAVAIVDVLSVETPKICFSVD